jgi:anti-anti-sigma factor
MVQFETSAGQLRVTFAGRLDTKTCKEITEQVEKELGTAGATVTFDLSGVDFVSSAFLRICICAAKQKAAGFSVVNVTPQVMAVFKMAGLDSAFKVTGV